jgi:hypothetical protein
VVTIEVVNGPDEDWGVKPLREAMLTIGSSYSNGVSNECECNESE